MVAHESSIQRSTAKDAGVSLSGPGESSGTEASVNADASATREASAERGGPASDGLAATSAGAAHEPVQMTMSAAIERRRDGNAVSREICRVIPERLRTSIVR